MSESHLVTIAKAVVEAINSTDAQETFVIPFVSERRYISRRNKDEFESGKAYVDVLHDGETTTLPDRSNTAIIDFAVQIAIRGIVLAEVGRDSIQVMDRYLLLAEQIKDYLRDNVLLDNVALTRIDHESIFDNATMSEHNVFLTGPVFIFRAQRS
jgi:hypothetical protein